MGADVEYQIPGPGLIKLTDAVGVVIPHLEQDRQESAALGRMNQRFAAPKDHLVQDRSVAEITAMAQVLNHRYAVAKRAKQGPVGLQGAAGHGAGYRTTAVPL